MILDMMVMDSLSEMVTKPQIKIFLYDILVMVFFHSNRKLENTLTIYLLLDLTWSSLNIYASEQH